MSPETGRRRLLFVVPPFRGHVNPALAVARRVVAQGHDVTWVGDPDMLREAPGRVFATRFRPPPRPAGARGFAALKYLWEQVLIPFADTAAPVVADALDAVRPDLVVADQQAFAGALVAERRGVPWATSATTSSEFTDPLAGQPQVAAWQQRLLDGLRERQGVASDRPDPRFSPHLVLLFSTPELTGPLAVTPPSLAFVGPALTTPPPPAHGSSSATTRPVLVTLGTTNNEGAARFLDLCEQALTAPSGTGAVIVDLSTPTPVRRRNVLRVGPIDQLEMLSRAGAVVCHGGHNTVCESLWYGLPLVVAPVRDDQPIVADQVVRAGAGVRVRFDRVDAEGLRTAVAAVTSDASYRDAAARVGASFRAAGGADRAARLLVGDESVRTQVSRPSAPGCGAVAAPAAPARC